MAFTSTIDLAKASRSALISFNEDTGNSWTFGTNYTNKDSVFETMVTNYLWPKLRETRLIQNVSGNRFDFLAREIEFIGQYSEEYALADAVPQALDMSKSAELLFKANYPKIISKLYHEGEIKRLKFTLNNNDIRQNFATIGDGIKYATAVLEKKLSDININEELEIKGMIVDYATRVTKDKRTASTIDDLINQLTTAVLNLQNNSAKHNEANLASGGAIGRYTTNTKLKDMMIITTDVVKTKLLNGFVANSFNIQGLDLTDRIISFEDMGGVYKTTKDITLTQPMVNYLNAFGDWESKVGDIIPARTIFTYDVSTVFTGSVEEIKPKSEIFATIMDVRTIRYNRDTSGMLKKPFENPQTDNTEYYISYYSEKMISPFHNKVTIVGA